MAKINRLGNWIIKRFYLTLYYLVGGGYGPYLPLLIVLGLLAGALYWQQAMTPLFALLVPITLALWFYPVRIMDQFLHRARLCKDYLRQIAMKLEAGSYSSHAEFDRDWQRFLVIMTSFREAVWSVGMSWCWDRDAIHRAMLELEMELADEFHHAMSEGLDANRGVLQEVTNLVRVKYCSYFDIGVKIEPKFPV